MIRTTAARVGVLLAALAALLPGASVAEAAVARTHVSYAPHLKRTIVHTRAEGHGLQLATWYGPGLYGNGLACGGRFSTRTWGIAHRTLPCGTLVTLAHRGRRVTVRVVDRGPFSGATVDLTSRTKAYLRFTSGHVRMTEVKRFRVLPRIAPQRA